ncbi:hypothetical protein L6164_034557 [Bauhinia variegata]|uniref:Uncharacterized protein n=1 Tax=Bauhinia variegata TaxID=167791 RepID=A0ACB9KVI6_BAUVA|nr:hypothetical protein L6164_034557 [Bauhinia variegata]
MADDFRRSGRDRIRVVVIGDAGTGKSSLIVALATESLPHTVSPVLPPTLLPDDLFEDHVPLTVVDTSSSLQNKSKRNEELRRADAVVLTYACDDPATFTRLSKYWLPELRKLEVKAPVIVVGCKLDLLDNNQHVSFEQVMSQLFLQFPEIVFCLECSAASLYQVAEVFYCAQKAVLYPVHPLFDHNRKTLTDRCVRALRRIFFHCDQDMDGALNNAELNEFQIRCFGTPLEPSQLMGVRTIVQQKVPEGVNQLGLTAEGFIFIHEMFLSEGRPEIIWAVLRKYGYDNDLKLRDDCLPVPSKHAPDQSVELTSEAMEFLNGIFRLHDTDKDRALQSAEVDKLFSAAPECPWNDAPYIDAAERTDTGCISMGGFLSQWALMTLLDPSRSLANLIYIGYSGSPAAALRVTRRRSVDRKKQATERNVFQCYVFGSKNAGKSTLLHSLLGRPFSSDNTPTTVEQYAVNVVEMIGGSRKTLILREIPEGRVTEILSEKNFLAACDVAVFVYDSSNERSWKRSRELLEEVARQGELTGYRVPCLLIAAKDDLPPYTRAVQDSVKATQELGIEAPIHLSMKFGDSSNVYNKIVNAAQHPHLSIPETEIGRKRKKYHHSVIFASVGTAVAFVGLAAFRAYAVKRNSSA